MPAADDLFRPTHDAVEADPAAAPADAPTAGSAGSAGEAAAPARRVRAVPDAASAPRRPSGRVRHDEKMTVYVTSEELLALEHARLGLRSQHGLAVDRGRVVREAVSMVLEDFETNGEASALVKRLRDE